MGEFADFFVDICKFPKQLIRDIEGMDFGIVLKQVFGNYFKVLILYYCTHLFCNKLFFFIISIIMCCVTIGLHLNLEHLG